MEMSEQEVLKRGYGSEGMEKIRYEELGGLN
jgi:hypothetical protein